MGGGRRLLAASGPISNFTLSVMLTKCAGTQPVDSASVAAIVNGYTATNLKVPLASTKANPNLYSGEPQPPSLIPLCGCISAASWIHS